MPSLNSKYIINSPAQDLTFRLEAGEHLRLVLINLTEPVDHRVSVELVGAEARVEIFALSMCGAVETSVRHLVPDTSSSQWVKFILPKEQEGRYYGHLYIAQGAQHTDAQQTNRNLLLAPTATMKTRPQLEIYADDVRASHGASTGMLDTSAMFYMQQRGIDPHTARKLLVGAFASEIVESIEDIELRDTVAAQIEQILESLPM